jgi:hypothetical protein
VWAQFLPIGLYEGLLGNSGAAISDPSAASFYNPSLLNRKTKDSYSISGNTLSSFSSKSDNTQVSSFGLNPGYLSTILVGDALVHEIFIGNTNVSKVKVKADFNFPDVVGSLEQNTDMTQVIFGYSMAFRSIPFALSYFGEYSQQEGTGFAQFTSLNSPLRSTESTKSDFKALGLGVSISGYMNSDSYTLGYQLRTRQLIVYKTDVTRNASFVHGVPASGDYSEQDSTFQNQNKVVNGSVLVIGHGFKSGNHEFLTDSQLSETSDLNYTYTLNQTFGYKYNTKSGHQLLTGIQHAIGPEVKYFGQSAYYSVGYSWLKTSLRSTFGAYYYTSRIGQDIFSAGLTFGSEFSY